MGERWAEIIAGLLKGVILHETIVAKDFLFVRERGFVYVPGFCGAGSGCSGVRNLSISMLEI